ncbi:YpzI family protein [Calidifontibacillus oryziterrae]|nr:YpzI family protein [Calidifontibacillus oryziterrae]
MGRDRQETKLIKSGRVQSDRDQSLNNKGATILEGPDEARERNK